MALHVCHAGLDEFVPLLGLAPIVGAAGVVGDFLAVLNRVVAVFIHFAEECLVVAVDVHLLGACTFHEVATPLEFLLLTGGQRIGAVAVVGNDVDGLERHTSCGEVAFADVCDAEAHVEVPVPGGIHAPVHPVFLTCGIHVEHDVHIGFLHRRHIV